MDHYREIKNNLKWHKEGRFEVELINGIITRLNFCEPGKGPEDTEGSLTSTNFKFLKTVYACLGDLFAFVEEENKRLGYKYSLEEDIQPYHEDETGDNTCQKIAEIKLRPLINYENRAEHAAAPGETNGSIRDVS